jgi:hypothetical protein
MMGKPLSKAAQKVLARGARTMLEAQADLPPTIIHSLQVLLDRASFPPAHVTWVEEGVRAIVAKWDRTEDLAQLRSDLGVGAGQKTRTKTLTMRRQTAIAASIANAAIAGAAKPKKVAGDEHQADDRELQRAWERWGPVYLARLELMKIQADREKRVKIRRAIDLLKPRRRRTRDKN